MAMAITHSAPAPKAKPNPKPTVLLAEPILAVEPYIEAFEPYVAVESVPVLRENYVYPSIYADDYYYPHVDIIV